MRKAYQTDLSDAEWSYIEPHLPTPNAPGRPRVHTLRDILDAIFHIPRSGCAWRLLPHDFPPWKTVHHYFRTWRLDGTWERVHAALRESVRVRLERNPKPSAAIVDSQSVKTPRALTAKSAATMEPRRSRDASGIYWWTRRVWCSRPRSTARTSRIVMASSSCSNSLEPAFHASHLWLDTGYTGQDRSAGWVERTLGWTAEIVRHSPKPAPEEVMKAWVREWNRESGHRREEVYATERPQTLLAEEMDS